MPRDPSFFSGLVNTGDDQQASRSSGGGGNSAPGSQYSISPSNATQNPGYTAPAPSATPNPTTQPTVTAAVANTLASTNTQDSASGGAYNLSTIAQPSGSSFSGFGGVKPPVTTGGGGGGTGGKGGGGGGGGRGKKGASASPIPTSGGQTPTSSPTLVGKLSTFGPQPPKAPVTSGSNNPVNFKGKTPSGGGVIGGPVKAKNPSYI